MAESNPQVNGGGPSAEEVNRKRRLEQQRNNVQIPSVSPTNNQQVQEDIDQKKEPATQRDRGHDVARRVAGRVKRHGEQRGAKDATEQLAGYGKSILSKYGWREFDTFLLGFCTITTFSVVGILLAVISIAILDIRWVAGYVSPRVPKMLIPQSLFLGALNFTLAVVLFMAGVVGVVLFCIVSAPADVAEQLVNNATGFSLDFFNSCF